jgi:ATP synthase in type III secretion protein N
MNAMLASLLPRLSSNLANARPRPLHGRVSGIRGTLVQASLADVGVGELCRLGDPANGQGLDAEVLGFAGDEAILSPIGSLAGLSTRTEIIATGETLRVPVGNAFLGRVVSPFGECLDTLPAVEASTRYPLHAEPPPPLTRRLIEAPLALGIRAIDGLLTVGEGQRLGIFGEPGVGKSLLLAAIVRGAAADVIVIGLIGERGREVRELLEGQLDAATRARTVAVVATSDRPATERVKAAAVATAHAEFFRDQGHRVLLVIDSLTRYARAQREIGLAIGEPPTRRGYPPSLFTTLPQLLERSGPAALGSITAFYTVLTEGEASLDPVAEEARSILDGHIVLSAQLAQRDHFPAIDVLGSRSRLMGRVASAEQRHLAARLRSLMSRHTEIELLLRTGDYSPGTDLLSDEAIARQGAIEAFLRQNAGLHVAFEDTLTHLREVFV